MWILYWVLLFVLIAVAVRQLVLYRAGQLVAEIIGTGPDGQISKLEQIRNLKEAGVCFRTEEMERRFVFDFSGNEYYASHPYYALLTDAGEKGLLQNVYGIGDRECIYDDAYGKILTGLGSISGLVFTDINCPDRHRVCWMYNGRKYTWRGKKQRDWADHRLAYSLNRFCKGEKLFFTDNTHEGIIYFYGTRQHAKRLNESFGLRFK